MPLSASFFPQIIFLSCTEGLILERLEADELWSFVGKKKNQVWIWLAMDATTRQVVAIHAGGRSEQDAKAFWAEVPEPYRSGCDVYTDEWDAYRGAIPPEVHFAVKKVWENESYRGSELHFTATDQSPCEKVGSLLEKFCQSHGRNSVFPMLLQSQGIRRTLEPTGRNRLFYILTSIAPPKFLPSLCLNLDPIGAAGKSVRAVCSFCNDSFEF